MGGDCNLKEASQKIGDKGIIRSHPFSPGQGSPWQSFCTLYDTEKAIFMAMDEPEKLHYFLNAILKKTLQVSEMWTGTPADMVETDGGAGSSTVISPAMFEEFCLPYDKKQNEIFHNAGLKVVCHLCGGMMPLLDLVVKADADGLETMTPSSMGGDCNLKEASQKIGDKLFFIGGFDQNAGFETGTPETARKQVFDCFEATKNEAGYIICPSDHFFHGNPDCLQAFSDAAKECVY
jgi:uroporphyrinogen-III decarboxylase